MNAKRLETLIWVFIYGGLLSLSLGWFAMPHRGPWGEVLMVGGVVATAAGVILIAVRARKKP